MASSNGGSFWRRIRRASAAAAGATALAVVVASCGTAGQGEQGAPPQSDETSAVSQARPASPAAKPPSVDADWPRWGFTNTSVSANNVTEEFQQVVAGNFAGTPMLQNQHIMGFGALNPEPYPGRFYWEDLDSRLGFMEESQATPIITLCCAPDWMKGGPQGPTEESSWDEHLEDAPYPEHYDDFAKLAAEVARRYSDVKYFMVWNEFKGFWPNHSKPANYKGYTQMYNKVYDAIKAVRPDAQIGGPYLGFDSNSEGNSELRGDWGVVNKNVLDAFNYWYEHKKGADFIVVDGASLTDDHEALPDDFGALSKFGAVTKWLRKKTDDLPIWWSEYYFESEDGSSQWQENKRLAVHAAALMEFARSGAATALYWSPQVKEGEGECIGCMWDPRSGDMLPTGELLQNFTKWFPAGAKIDDKVESSDPAVSVLAQDKEMLLVNTTDDDVVTTVDGQDFQLKPYEVRWSER